MGSDEQATVVTRHRSIVTIGVSLKMYFGYDDTIRWCGAVRDIGRTHAAVTNGSVELFVIPSYPALARARDLFVETRVGLGAQNLHWEDAGAFTGEVSGAMLAATGCRYVEVGHAERRRMFGETEEIVAAKTAAALRNGLVPIVCIGEPERRPAAEALLYCVQQLGSALSLSQAMGGARIIVAYEPIWAIGAPEPAPVDHIRAICAGLRAAVTSWPGFEVTIIYGGAAGPGLLGMLPDADGLFLGRSAHVPEALEAVLDEALLLGQ